MAPNRSIAAAAALAAALALNAAYGGDVYRWTDRDGVTHYTASPPEEGEYRRLSRPGARPEPAPAKSLPQRLDALEEQGAPKVEDARPTEAQIREQNCIRARKDVALLAGDRPVVTTGDEGRSVLLEADARAAALAEARQMKAEFCGP